MEGADGEENQGMIPRAVEQIFITANELQTKGWKVPKINIVQFEQKIYDLRFWSWAHLGHIRRSKVYFTTKKMQTVSVSAN